MARQARRHNPGGGLVGNVVQLGLLAAAGYVGWRVVQSYQAGQQVTSLPQLAQLLIPSSQGPQGYAGPTDRASIQAQFGASPAGASAYGPGF